MKPNLGRRILAGFIDYTIICVVCYLLILVLGEPNEEGGYSLKGLPALIPISFWAIMTVGFEQWFGATLGNGITGLKPVQENLGGKISVSQSMKRHLLDPVDMSFFGLVGFITISNTKKKQRLGDIWAKTIVVNSN